MISSISTTTDVPLSTGNWSRALVIRCMHGRKFVRQHDSNWWRRRNRVMPYSTEKCSRRWTKEKKLIRPRSGTRKNDCQFPYAALLSSCMCLNAEPTFTSGAANQTISFVTDASSDAGITALWTRHTAAFVDTKVGYSRLKNFYTVIQKQKANEFITRKIDKEVIRERLSRCKVNLSTRNFPTVYVGNSATRLTTCKSVNVNQRLLAWYDL